MSRIPLFLGVGAAALVVVLLLPGPEIEPYHAPPDPTLRFTPVQADSLLARGARGAGAGPAAITPPRLLNFDETLAFLGNVYETYRDRPGFGDTIVLSLRIDEQGRVGPIRRLSGNGDVVGGAEMVARYQRYAPARNASGQPVAIWWPVRIATRVPMTLELDGMVRGDLPSRPAPPGGFTVAELENDPPTFTPLTALPTVVNAREVARRTAALLRDRPRSDGWVGREVSAFFLIDRDGAVRRIRLNPDGNAPENETARRIAGSYRFTPARRGRAAVVSWVRMSVPVRPDSAD